MLSRDTAGEFSNAANAQFLTTRQTRRVAVLTKSRGFVFCAKEQEEEFVREECPCAVADHPGDSQWDSQWDDTIVRTPSFRPPALTRPAEPFVVWGETTYRRCLAFPFQPTHGRLCLLVVKNPDPQGRASPAAVCDLTITDWKGNTRHCILRAFSNGCVTGILSTGTAPLLLNLQPPQLTTKPALLVTSKTAVSIIVGGTPIVHGFPFRIATDNPTLNVYDTQTGMVSTANPLSVLRQPGIPTRVLANGKTVCFVKESPGNIIPLPQEPSPYS